MEPLALKLDKTELKLGTNQLFPGLTQFCQAQECWQLVLHILGVSPSQTLGPGHLINQLFLIRIITRDFLPKVMNETLCCWKYKGQAGVGRREFSGMVSSSRKEGFAASLLFIP